MNDGKIQEARREALAEAIRYSGMGIDEFATRCLARSVSTVYRWLSGARPVPRSMAVWLERDGYSAIDGVIASDNHDRKDGV